MENISNALLYDPNLDVYFRNEKVGLLTSSMKTEFIYVLEKFLNIEIDITTLYDNFTVVIESYLPIKGVGKCICTHDIKKFFYIRYIHTNKVFRVGCDCFDKIDGKGIMCNLLIAYQNDRICYYCKQKFRKNKSISTNCLCKNCYEEILSYDKKLFTFGKYKGKYYEYVAQINKTYFTEFLFKTTYDEKLKWYIKLKFNLDVPMEYKKETYHKFLLK